MQNKCENCNGEGLVGQGEQPWLRQGRLETCKPCGGKGKVSTQPVGQPTQSAPTPEITEGGEKKEGDNSTLPAGSTDIPPAVEEANLPPSDIEPAVQE